MLYCLARSVAQQNIFVHKYSSTKIRITGIPNSKDVVPVRNQILELDMVNIKVTGEIDTIAVGDTGASSTYTTASSSASNTSY